MFVSDQLAVAPLFESGVVASLDLKWFEASTTKRKMTGSGLATRLRPCINPTLDPLCLRRSVGASLW